MSTKVLRILQAVLFLSIITLSIFLRFYHLDQNPGIYSDEGTILNVVKNLIEGRSEYLGVQGSLLLLGRMPVFPYLLKILAELLPINLLSLRIVTASAGVFTIVLLFFCLQDILSKELPYVPYLASLFLALNPHAVLFSRIGFGYNLLAPLTITVYWMLWKFIQTRKWKWLLIASILGSFGILVELAYTGFLFFIALIAILETRKRSVWIFLILTLPFTLYFVLSWMIFGDSFLFDWKFTLLRINAPIMIQLGRLILVYAFSLWNNPEIIIGMFGFLFMPNKRLSLFTLASFVIPLLILLRSVSIGYQSFYYLIPYYPLIFIGIGALSVQGVKTIVSYATEIYNLYIGNKLPVFWEKYARGLLNISLLLMFILPSLVSLNSLSIQVMNSFVTNFDPLMIPLNELRSVTEYVNKHVSSSDLVLASPAIAWAIHAQATDYQISIAVNKGGTIHFPLGIPKERMRFDTDYHQAKYFIVDSIVLNWGQFVIPETQQILREVQSQWMPVYQTKVITVYKNPSKE